MFATTDMFQYFGIALLFVEYIILTIIIIHSSSSTCNYPKLKNNASTYFPNLLTCLLIAYLLILI